MAQPAPMNLFEIVANDATLQATIANTRRHLGLETEEVAPVGFIDDSELDAELLKSLVLTHLNGYAELQDQHVHVEYLKRTDRLKLPAILNARMDTITAPEQAEYSILVERYWKVSTRTYAQLRAMIQNRMPYAEIRTAIDNLVAPAMEGLYKGWDQPRAYDVTAGNPDDPTTVTMTFSSISCALGFGCDLRDSGVLRALEMRMTDDYWSTLDRTTANISRLQSQLYPYSLQTIAALNYPGVASSPLAAWTRAFGVSCGVLPSVTSKCVREYDFVLERPTRDSFTKVIEFEALYSQNIKSICLNLLAMFGLLHLAKDHTFKTNDSDMGRICTSYIATIRTMVPTELADQMKTQLEPLCRTAQHPFGLGQTYAVAIIMYYSGKLAKPLKIRMNVTPPPVQRLMIVNAATNEWKNVAAGSEINEMYKREIATVKAEIAKIRMNPPSYSGLCRLYGIQAQSEVAEIARDAAETMMPMIYGFAMSQHCDDDQRKDGIALALSLSNVQRDHGILAQKFVTMWDRYMEGMEQDGLLRTARDARASMGLPPAAP